MQMFYMNFKKGVLDLETYTFNFHSNKIVPLDKFDLLIFLFKVLALQLPDLWFAKEFLTRAINCQIFSIYRIQMKWKYFSTEWDVVENEWSFKEK